MSKMKSQKSLRKPPPIVAIPTSRDAESDVQFELELCWCVQQLENSLNSGKLNQKVADDTVKNLKTLKSGTAPLIKKRQTMKAALGDYRAKMKEEEKKMALASKQIKFTAAADANMKSSFVKKSAILTTGQDFRFDFNQPGNGQDVGEDNSVKNNGSTAIISKDLNWNSGGGFKFNFDVSDSSTDLSMNELSIKN